MTSMWIGSSSPFGTYSRTAVLITLALLGESYPRELARILQVSLSAVQKAIVTLERDGIIAGRSMGRTRIYRLDPRYFAPEDLRQYLLRLAGSDMELKGRIAQLRRRPRRTSKPL